MRRWTPLRVAIWTSALALSASCGGAQPAPEQASPPGRCPSDPPPGVLPLTAAMAPPTLLSGKEIVYSEEAIAARAAGTSQVRCVITAEGAVTRCRVRESVPYMDRVIVEALQSRRYAPARSQGKPVAVDYPFVIRLVLPESAEPAPPAGAAQPPDPSASAAQQPPDPSPPGVIPFGPNLTRPRLISGQSPVYTKEAREACVEGLMIVRCVIEKTEGSLTSCRVLKSLPYMQENVLAALKTHRYTPVMYLGKPVDVDYVFNIRLRLK